MAVESCGEILALPEDCIAYALSLTTPKDACRLSAVATTFRSASQSDTVWSRFLPSDYCDIISRAVDAGTSSELAKLRSKKDLYLYLCDHPILIDGGLKSFSLEKLTGKKCYMLSARDLVTVTVWSRNPQYWRWISLPESRFPEVAELLERCGFEVRGKISSKILSPCTNYAAYLVFTCNSELHGNQYLADAFLAMGGHEGEKCYVVLGQNVVSEPSAEHPKKRSDGWMEVKLGEYFVECDGDLELSLLQMTGNLDSGLIIQGIEIRPKEKKMREAEEEEKQEREEATQGEENEGGSSRRKTRKGRSKNVILDLISKFIVVFMFCLFRFNI